MTTRFIAAVLAYVVPTFALGFVWHLILFDGYYHRLAIYREDIIIPFGLFSMLIQAVLFAWLTTRPSRSAPAHGSTAACSMQRSAHCCRGASPRSPSPPRT